MNREPRSVKLGVLGGVNQAWNQGLLTVVLLSVIAVVPRTQLELGNIESALRATAVLLLFFLSPRASCSTDEAERPSCGNEKAHSYRFSSQPFSPSMPFPRSRLSKCQPAWHQYGPHRRPRHHHLQTRP